MENIDLPFDFVAPFATDDTAPFFEGCEVEEFRVQQCDGCDTYRFPPAPACPECASLSHTWRVSPGGASVATFTVHYRNGTSPYAVVIARLEHEKVHFATNVIDFTVDTPLAVGQPLTIEFRRETTSGAALPYVRATA